MCRGNLDDPGRQNLFVCFIAAFQLCCLLEDKGTNELFLSSLEGGEASSTSDLSKYV